MRRLFCFFLIGLSYPLNSQNPFNCHGRIFRVLEQQGGSMLQELVSNQMEEFLFEDLRFFPSRRMNAIGFRESDGYIYGLLLGEQYTLCRIDAGFQLHEIRTLSALPPNLLFVASDISPDNRYMVILGYSPDEPGNLLALIDLESSDFHLDLYSLGSDSDLSNVKCADIAFHPTTGQLYGYDHANYELVEIDINRKYLKRISTGSNEPSIRGNVPSLFFDVDGNLYGIGSEREVLSNRSLILFSVNSPSVKILKNLAFEGNQDACSCTASFQLFNSARNSSMINCTTNELKIEIRNFTGNTYSTTLTDTFPSGVRIIDLHTRMNYSGVEGLGTNRLKINDLQISETIDSIILQVFVEPDNPVLNYANKVYLRSDEILPGINRKSIGSDDPATLVINDATWLEFRDLDFRFEKDTYFLCQDDSLFLSADIAADYFVWSTGSLEPAIWVTKPGTYQITLQTECDQAIAQVEVKTSVLELQLGNDVLLDPGAGFEIKPQILGNRKVISYLWNGPPGTISCISCLQTKLFPRNKDRYTLSVTNEDGCLVIDSINLDIEDVNIYIPNAFTPNGDRINDHFRIYGPANLLIRELQIFDRWGNLVFNEENIPLFSSESAWDGLIKGKKAMSGVYVYRVYLEVQNRLVVHFSGEVVLLR